MDILLTGGTGQVGTELIRSAWPAGISLHAPPRDALDLIEPAAIGRVFAERSYSAVISCAGYTAVDDAERDPQAARRLNALAPGLLARAAAGAGIPIVHLSTDYVFDGTSARPYREDDPVDPINVYGATKAEGERAVRAANPHHGIIRTAWVISPHRRNFVKTMLALAGSRDELSVVSDQRGCPTIASDLADAIRRIALALIENPDGSCGTYHVVNAGETTWAELAEAAFAGSARRGGPTAKVRPVTAADYPTLARRPANSRLSTAKVTGTFGIEPRHWRPGLDDILDALLGPPLLPVDGEAEA